MGQKLAMIPAADQYVKDANGDYTYIGDDADAIAERFDSAEQLKIVGVVKPIKDASATPLATGIGYTRALTDELIDHANSSAIVTDQEKDRPATCSTAWRSRRRTTRRRPLMPRPMWPRSA